MEILEISESERDGIFTTLAAVLHLGDAGFYKGLASAHDVAVLRDEHEAEITAHLLGLDAQHLIKALMHKQTEARGEQIFSPRNTEQAIDARDAIAKELYSRVFTWLVNRVNGMVFHGKQRSSIAILDIFGFEDFRINSFEQLCINYANESLQFFFNQFIFKMEQDEYTIEGIPWHEVKYTDNQACLDLMAKPPHGILHLLSDESNFPKATDLSFLEKCHQYHKASKAYVKPKMHVPEFAVSHFAGTVTYKVHGFLDKNRDGLKQDLTDLLCKTNSEFIKDLIPDLCEDPEMEIGSLKMPRENRKNSLKAPPNSIQKSTVCAKFNDSLIRLVVAMKRCNPFFVRCIRPNPDKAPDEFVEKLVLDQIRYCGILETVKIRKTGFPIRIVYPNFVKRYRCLTSTIDFDVHTLRENAAKILELVQVDKDSYAFGSNKVFLRESVECALEEAREVRIERMAVLLQARIKGFVLKRRYLQMKKAAILLQCQTRRYLQRKKYLKARRGFHKLQVIFRMRQQRKRLMDQIKVRDEARQDAQKQTTAMDDETPGAPVEPKDWDRQPIVDVTHLEIPAELAVVYANLDTWNAPFKGKISPYRGELIRYNCPSAGLPRDIDAFLFSKFADENFQKEHRWRMTKSPISSSFLKLNYSDAMESVTIFKLVMRFMEDETLDRATEFIIGNYIIQRGLLNPEVRDEIYCQLCNQVWGNPKESSNEKAWLLMALCMSSFMPSSTLFPHLLKFASDQAYNGYKAYCQHKLLCWKGRKFPYARAHPPSSLEWQAARTKSCMSLECDCVDGETRAVQVDSCSTGEQLAGQILKDRGIPDPYGWSVDLYDTDCHFSLCGHDYAMDLLSEYEYPPTFPPSLSPTLLTFRPGNKLPEKRKRAMIDLHRPPSKRAHVADIAHKFSFSERPASTIPQPQAPREDALSAATSARIVSQAATDKHQDRLVSETAARSRVETTDGPAAVIPPPPPPPPPASNVPAPPPPPPVMPPQKVIMRKPTKKKDKKESKKEGPQYSLAEVVAKAKRMSETRSRVFSTSSGGGGKETEVDAFEAVIKQRQGNLKPRKVETTAIPEDKPESELKRVMQAKANRVSRLWESTDASLAGIQSYQKPSIHKGEEIEMKSRAEQLHKSWADPEKKERSISCSSSGRVSNHSGEVPATTIQVDDAPSSSRAQQNDTNNHDDVSDFVDSLFDPVISNFDELMKEDAVRVAIKGGGGVQQGITNPNASQQNAFTARVSTPSAGVPANTVGVSSHIIGISSPAVGSIGSPVAMNGPMFVPIQRAPMSNGYAQVAVNGYPGYSTGMVAPTYVPMATSYSSPVPDVNSLAAQQQVLIDRLLQQQALLHQQQQELSQKSQDQLVQLQLQHAEELRRLQEQISGKQTGMLSGITNGHGPTANGHEPTSNGHEPTTNGHEPPANVCDSPLSILSPSTSTSSVGTLNKAEHCSASADLPLPPPEFSDLESSAPIPPPPPQMNNTSAPPPPNKEKQTAKPPAPLPPPRIDSQLVNNDISKSAGVASAVAMLEAKTPNSPTSKTPEVSVSISSSRAEVAGDNSTLAKPPLQRKQSSTLAHLYNQEIKTTKLLNKLNDLYVTVERVGWKMSIRKEIFNVNEKLDNKLAQRLVFLQVVRDVYSDACCRMTSDDRSRMKVLLQKYGITPDHPLSSVPVEEIVIATARQLPLYFSRFYLATCQNEQPDMHYVAVGEHGIRLVKREKLTDDLIIVQDLPYDSVEKVKAAKDKLTISIKDSKTVISTDRAEEIKLMISPYLRQIEKEAKYVRAMYDYVTQEPNLLSFKKGDVIQIIDKPDIEEGWLFGVFASNNGYFPAEYVTHIKEDPGTVRKGNLMKAASLGNLFTESADESPKGTHSRRDSVRSSKSDKSEYGHEKFSMMEFAMHYFRHGQEVVHRQSDGSVRGTLRIKGTNRSGKGSTKKVEWTWKGLAELVKYSKTPIQASLLRLDSPQNKHAIECFHAIMRFMGDISMGRNHKDTELVYFLLKTCRENERLCDEVYCQLVKQVTSNKSACEDSCSRGWRLLIIMTSYVTCDEFLKPYLVKFLQSTASDPKREFHGAAAICEQNLMKTFKYGGRRTPPSAMELKQLVQGRQSKRQVFLLPGMVSKMIKIQTCSTGFDVIKEMCNEMELFTEDDYREYGVFTQLVKQNVMVPVQTTDYIMDVIGQLERQEIEFSLWFKRVLWYQPCHFDNELYVSIIYNQVMPGYMRGQLVGLTNGRTIGDAQFQNEVAEIGALQILATRTNLNAPAQSDVDSVVPKFMRERLRPQQWLILVQDHFRSFQGSSPHQARRKILEKVTKWPFFGSSFFLVKHCSHPNVAGECVIAINKQGIHFISPASKQSLHNEPFPRIISTRILVSDKKRFFLDLKIGDSMVQKVTRMETQEAKDIANLIYSYVSMTSEEMNRPNEGLAGVLRSQQDLRL
ncbi:unconventional myosin-XV isoform X2 [Nematostella vectensis]|nr:unconventional myosin-XV isoform X2 [Nematostella vectensis]XP_032227087.2 unconventional myosin-XV isoform X2 [Nematostella vectensis]